MSTEVAKAYHGGSVHPLLPANPASRPSPPPATAFGFAWLSPSPPPLQIRPAKEEHIFLLASTASFPCRTSTGHGCQQPAFLTRNSALHVRLVSCCHCRHDLRHRTPCPAPRETFGSRNRNFVIQNAQLAALGRTRAAQRIHTAVHKVSHCVV
jgi:hypothetical protein